MYQKNSDNTLTFYKFVNVQSSTDNIFIDPDDGSLWIGCHPSPISFAVHALTKEHKHAPHTPSHVVRIAPDLSKIDQILMSNGRDISASSAAGRVGDRLIITPVFDDHILICSKKQQQE